jgi:hypothetical protein
VEEEEHAEFAEEAVVEFGIAAVAIAQQDYLAATFAFSKYVVLWWVGHRVDALSVCSEKHQGTVAQLQGMIAWLVLVRV